LSALRKKQEATGEETVTDVILREIRELGESIICLDQHLSLIAGEDVRKVIEDNIDRIVAVHLKDWTSEFGRSYQFYSRGFGIQF